jgi:hypothetical protein
VTAGPHVRRARDSISIHCFPAEELGDTIMAGIEEDDMAVDVVDQKQFYE